MAITDPSIATAIARLFLIFSMKAAGMANQAPVTGRGNAMMAITPSSGIPLNLSRFIFCAREMIFLARMCFSAKSRPCLYNTCERISISVKCPPSSNTAAGNSSSLAIIRANGTPHGISTNGIITTNGTNTFRIVSKPISISEL